MTTDVLERRDEAALFWREQGLMPQWARALVKQDIMTTDQLVKATDVQVYLVHGLGTKGTAAVQELRDRLATEAQLIRAC